MSKKVAVLVLNPVNGFGLFQYLETFYENKIQYETFAVADSVEVKANSGVCLRTDSTVANLKGRENEFDVLVFACGDAIPKMNENIGKGYYQDMFGIIKKFADKGKILVGHCASAVVFDNAGVGAGKKMAVHPYGKAGVKHAVPTDRECEIDGNIYTAQTEHSIRLVLPELLKALK